MRAVNDIAAALLLLCAVYDDATVRLLRLRPTVTDFEVHKQMLS